MNNINDYQDYEGVDASLETSLFEYGLIWAKGIKGHENDYHFIYGVGVDDNGEYNLFDWGDIAIDANPEEEWDFVDWDAVASSVGGDKSELLSMPIPEIVFDLIGYYGTANVFGSSYYPFKITQEEASCNQ